MQPISGNQRPDLPTSLMKMSLVLRVPREMHLCRSSSSVPRLPWFLKLLQLHVLLTFGKVQNPSRMPHKITPQLQKVARDLQFLTLLTCERVSRHNGVQFSTSQLAKVVRMCCVFSILTSTCAWLRATAACTF